MAMTLSIAAVLLSLLQAPPAATSLPPEPPTEVEGVTVTGRRDGKAQRKAESDFVQELAAPTRRRLARWRGSLCVTVAGLPEAQAQYVVDRVAAEALAVGLEAGAPGCRPEALILFVDDGPSGAAAFRARQPRFFTGGTLSEARMESGGGGQRLDDFVSRPRAVRWWHVSHRVPSDGSPLATTGIENRTIATRPAWASRLGSFWTEELSRAVVIVDAREIGGVSGEALTAYLAMVTLAQLDPEAEPQSLETIMSLFADRAAGRTAASTLTDWDRAYLKGLYAAPADVKTIQAQLGELERSLAQTRKLSR